MAARHPRLVFTLITLLLFAALASCGQIRGPGIMPPVNDWGGSQWDVLDKGFKMVQTAGGEKQWRWQIMARYIPEEGKPGLNALDISAQIDGIRVPFTFEERGQVFESVTTSSLDPGPHKFELGPSAVSSRTFPTLSVQFEAP